MFLSELVKINRRYTRSVNLERDINIPDSVLGYVPTNKPLETLKRFISSFNPNSIRRWTITGVYGTGKSSFVHFLAALCAPISNPIRNNAYNILKNHSSLDKKFIKELEKYVSKEGLFRAVITATREPIARTIVKALYQGAELQYDIKADKFAKLRCVYNRVLNEEQISDIEVLNLIKEIAYVNRNGLLLIIDELGKNLEFATNNQCSSDLYLLQQIAELPSNEKSPKIFVFGILHQAFSEYTYGISLSQKNEWMKIQGRFEDIPFTEAPEQIIKLIGSSISFNDKGNVKLIDRWAKSWKSELEDIINFRKIDVDTIKSIYPLHPVSSVLLPILSGKYAQNDRTIFTFLSSFEPYSFNTLIREMEYDSNLSTVKLYNLYDYFVETAGVLISSRPHFQRWNEIQSRISDANSLESEKINLLKTIGMLNLVSAGGALRASRELVINCMINSPENKDKAFWNKLIDDLEAQKFITVRKQLDEIRIWEGSDFNIEEGVSKQIEKICEPLDNLLNDYYPLKPLIAQRHSYKTGTLRYFERKFCKDEKLLQNIDCNNDFSDGLIVYWVQKEKPSNIPAKTNSGKPLMLLSAKNLKILEQNCLEFVALNNLRKSSAELQIDPIARKEINQRIFIAQQLLDKSLEASFSLIENDCFANGRSLKYKFTLNAILSDLCDEIYKYTPVLWNELINKRELTSQGAKARRELMNAMLDNYEKKRLGIEGYGPEYCIYQSLLLKTNIHSRQNGKYVFTSPEDKILRKIWDTIENYCLSAINAPYNVLNLYEILDAPPYGLKRGIAPIFLLAVLIANNHKLSLYIDNKFIPKITNEYIELLLKKPERFSIKNSQPTEVQNKVINELYTNLFKTKSDYIDKNSILNIAKALVRLVKDLPEYSKNTTRISTNAISVRKNIKEISEPDKILFQDLPISLGYPKFTTKKVDEEKINLYCQDLIKALKEISYAYDNLLDECRAILIKDFAIISGANIQEELSKRAKNLSKKSTELWLKRFINAINDQKQSQKEWLEAVIMVMADRPADTWYDNDFEKFKIQSQDLARRFLNLEAIYKEITGVFGENINARKINYTNSNGKEVNRILWIDDNIQTKAEKLCKEFFNRKDFGRDNRLKEAMIAVLIDTFLAENSVNSSEKAGINYE